MEGYIQDIYYNSLSTENLIGNGVERKNISEDCTMKYEVKYHPQKNMVAMKLDGQLKLEQVAIPLNNAVNKMLEFGCNRPFIDLSKTSYAANGNELMDLQKIFNEAGLARSYKQAVYIPHDFQERKAVENFCRYHGWSIRFFTNAITAKQWLIVQ